VLTSGAKIIIFCSLISPQTSQGFWLDRMKVVFEKTKPYMTKKSDYLIQMPYYGQVGQECWAECTTMLIKGYMGAQPGEAVSKALNFVKVNDSDFGINLIAFESSLLYYISAQTDGKEVIWRGFSSSQHMKWEILRLIESGRPVMLRLGGHVVLIIGYQNGGKNLIIHDPQNISPPDETSGTMYTIRPWSWFEDHISLYRQANQLLWVNEPLTSAKTLQTIQCSGGNEEHCGNPYGEVNFIYLNPLITNPDKKEVSIAKLQFKPSSVFGYTWENVGLGVSAEPVQGKADVLKLQLPIWNASFENKSLTVKTQINQGATKIYSNETAVSIGKASYNAKAESEYKIYIPLEEIRNVSLGDAQGTQK